MSESPPVPPDTTRPSGPKRRSLGCLIAGGVIAAVLVFLALDEGSRVEVRDGPRPDDGIRQMVMALSTYASEHDGHLPPTLQAMIPDYLTQENFADFRYPAQKTGKRLDWLYFPREKLDVLPEDTILLASPSPLLNTSGVQLRIVTTAAGDTDYIPEADFQRLIREQNPAVAP